MDSGVRREGVVPANVLCAQTRRGIVVGVCAREGARTGGRLLPGKNDWSGTCDQTRVRTLNEWRDESNELVVYSRPPSTSNREPTAVIVWPTRPDGERPAVGEKGVRQFA